MRPREVREAWVSEFWPEFEGDENHRGISSHYGRHFFTTFWRVEQDLNRDLIKYMRGDTTDPSVPFGRETIDTYIHTTYEDIEGTYRERIFKLRL
jgi:integrase/recombinase XerD